MKQHMEIRTGLLGAGFIAASHVRALAQLPGVRIGWICDADLRKAEALASLIPGARATASLDEMLAAKPDVVHVLLPPEAHATAAVSALTAGAHVFVEKPLATSAREARLIATAAEVAGRRVGVNHNLVFNVTFRKLVDAIRRRKLGELEHVSFTWNVPLPWRQAKAYGHWLFQRPENILFEQAVHPLSAVELLLGGLESVSVLPCRTTTLVNGAAFHRTWQVSMELERGTAQLFLSFGGECTEIAVSAIGQDGVARADLKRNRFSLRRNGFHEPPLDDLFGGLDEGFAIATQSAGNFTKAMLGFVRALPPFDPWGNEIAESVKSFYTSLASGAPSPVDLARGVAIVEMCEAVGLAAGGAVQPRLESRT